MAMLKGAKGSQLVIRFLTAPGPPKVFSAACSINAEREFALEASVTESVGIDCEDPEAPGWQEVTVDSLAGTVTGSGRHQPSDYEDLWAWFTSGEARECQVAMNVSAANGGDITEGDFVITNLSRSGTRGGFVEFSITLRSSGELVRVDAPA